MKDHAFIFSPGLWIGEGKISLNMVAEELDFSITWNFTNKDISGKVQGVQETQIEGLSETMRNELFFFDFSKGRFALEMENNNVGRVVGTGLLDEKIIAWEFRENDLDFEGFESYKLQEDGSYLMMGEYITTDQLRTQIQGKVWKQKELDRDE